VPPSDNELGPEPVVVVVVVGVVVVVPRHAFSPCPPHDADTNHASAQTHELSPVPETWLEQSELSWIATTNDPAGEYTSQENFPQRLRYPGSLTQPIPPSVLLMNSEGSGATKGDAQRNVAISEGTNPVVAVVGPVIVDDVPRVVLVVAIPVVGIPVVSVVPVELAALPEGHVTAAIPKSRVPIESKYPEAVKLKEAH
jgi:hypothetical protein